MRLLSAHPKTATFLIFVLSLLLALAMIEAGTRAFVAVPSPYPLEPDSTVMDSRGFWTMAPGFSGRFDNRADFRDQAVSVHPDGTRAMPCASDVSSPADRVFLLGDSQTFGWGLNDDKAWPNRLQCLLNETAPARFRIFNLGVPGTQADQYWVRGFTQVLPALRPGDTVVVSLTWNDLVTFYAGDDFVKRALANAGLREVSKAGAVAVESSGEIGPISPSAEDIQARLTLPVVYLNPQTWRYRLYKRFGLFVPAMDSVWGFADSLDKISAAMHVLLPKLRLLYYRIRPDNAFQAKVSQRGFAQNFLVMKALERLVVRKGGRFMVQLLPNRLFFDDDYYGAYSKNGVSFPAKDYMGYVSAPLCAGLSLRCVNRFDVLQTSVRDAHTFAADGHYNVVGAERIARALARDVLGR